MAITLEELLASRDARVEEQQRLLRLYPQKGIICLTVIMPGENKRNELTLKIADAATNAIEEQFNDAIIESIKKDLNTGYEAFYVVNMEPLKTKAATCYIEENHPLGRLFDIDVITPEGPIQRNILNLPERRCLICEKQARYCIRARNHSTEEIMEKIKKILFNYVR